MTEAPPPYLRIVAEIERRIAAGELRPGDPVPTTRAIVREFGVAMAAATAALAALTQAGAIDSAARVRAAVASRRLPSRTDAGPDRERVIRVAVDIADTGGLAALSLHSVATELGVATMTLHRHLGADSDLTRLIADAAFAEIDYPDPPPDRRSHLGVAARLQWEAYRRHPWLPRLVSLTRPATLPAMAAYETWTMRAFDDSVVDPGTRRHIYATLVNFVRGIAIDIETEATAPPDPESADRRWGTSEPGAEGPLIDRLTESAPAVVELESLFAFGLERLLDGLAVVMAPRPRG
ncbi:GntR family transcriptional regulator [Nocardia sp. NPDC024068]|uniref:GntR family transcriptional regulator n=1 Tax=Nocardia sp. NPDC024068 TaxID=3157197 RepID=UPI0033F64771